jgi:hypothetical protein
VVPRETLNVTVMPISARTPPGFFIASAIMVVAEKAADVILRT